MVSGKRNQASRAWCEAGGRPARLGFFTEGPGMGDTLLLFSLHPCHWRAMILRSSASMSLAGSPPRSTVTEWIVPVKAKGVS